ncbi:Fc.00g091640.m01.CDS01 [Cosmosporella sp. VM-42]
MAQLEPYRGGYYLWHYLPSRAASIIFIIIFLAATSAVAWRMFKTKTWYCSVFVIGGLFEFIGYAARAAAYNKTGELMPFVIQNTFILLAPALFAASVYMVLGRIIRKVKGEAYSLVPVKWLTKVFVLGDVVSFMVQGGAAGLMATGDNQKLSENIVVAGLFVQIIVFGFFVITTVVFQMRMQKYPTAEAQDPAISWKKDFYMLYGISALIVVRSVFRIIEFIMGYDGYLLRHEWTISIFDGLLMFIVMVIFFIRYPARLATKGWTEGVIPLNETNR